MPSSIGLPELLIVLVIVLVILGPKRLPALGRQLGGGMRNFKDAITGRDDDDADELPAAHAREETEPLDGDVVPDRKP
jgi:sec-independent protein translocase protein TatA